MLSITPKQSYKHARIFLPNQLSNPFKPVITSSKPNAFRKLINRSWWNRSSPFNCPQNLIIKHILQIHLRKSTFPYNPLAFFQMEDDIHLHHFCCPSNMIFFDMELLDPEWCTIQLSSDILWSLKLFLRVFLTSSETASDFAFMNTSMSSEDLALWRHTIFIHFQHKTIYESSSSAPIATAITVRACYLLPSIEKIAIYSYSAS